MLYFKNSELAYTYHVSAKTVRNWIESAKQGKLDLVLHEQSGRSYVANTAGNIATIERLVDEGKKYRPHTTVKTVSPKPEFYRLFTQTQIYDIVSSLEIHRELPRQYNYFGEGAHHWDEYLAHKTSPELYDGNTKLMALSTSYLSELLGNYKFVNIVDVGVGNAQPLKDFIGQLLADKKLKRYIALDISPQMLDIAEKNVHRWFDGAVNFEGYELDINFERFSNILAESYLNKDAKETLNLIFILGGTFYNMRSPEKAFSVVYDSMGISDILIHTTKLDSEETRKHFDFNVNPGSLSISPTHGYVLDLLSIDSSLYDIEAGFDNVNQQRYERLRFKTALKIRFDFEDGTRELEFNKNETILIWRYWQQDYMTVMTQFSRNGFYTLHSSQTDDQEYMLTISRIKRD